MKTYNRIMEIFWFILGVGSFSFAGFQYYQGQPFSDLKYFFVAGAMALLLAVFRFIFRKNITEKE